MWLFPSTIWMMVELICLNQNPALFAAADPSGPYLGPPLRNDCIPLMSMTIVDWKLFQENRFSREDFLLAQPTLG